MVNQIEMALADIIKANKNTPRRGGVGRKFKTNRKAGGAPRGSAVDFRNSPKCGAIRGRDRANYTRGDVNSAWKHDMFNDFAERKIQRSGGGGAALTTEPTKLLVSNLDFGVSDTDIQELFEDFGVLKSAFVHYDRSGRSLGTANVVFQRRTDASKAMKQYNGVPLDGRPLRIQLATSEVSTFTNVDRVRLGGRGDGGSSCDAARRSQGRGYPGRDNPRRAAGRGAGRGKRPVLTAEQLDAELDAYVKEIDEVNKKNKVL